MMSRDETGPSSSDPLSDTLRWAFELDANPALVGATWLAREIVPGAADPFEAILSSAARPETLDELKNAFKLLRTTGASGAERSLAARLYAATIAVALVRHGKLITTQRGDALLRAFSELHADASMPERIRDVALQAIDAARRSGGA